MDLVLITKKPSHLEAHEICLELAERFDLGPGAAFEIVSMAWALIARTGQVAGPDAKRNQAAAYLRHLAGMEDIRARQVGIFSDPHDRNASYLIAGAEALEAQDQ